MYALRMRWIALCGLLLAGCGRQDSEIPTVVRGEKFDEASLVEKDKITILAFGADW